jgi:hypothetical protein
MELQVGRAYLTRGGHYVEIQHKRQAAFAFLGTVYMPNGIERSGEAWTKRGRHYSQKHESDEFDIIGDCHVLKKPSPSAGPQGNMPG